MKRRIQFFCGVFTFTLMLAFAFSITYAKETKDEQPFKEVYLISQNGNYGGETIYSFLLADEENHVYILKEKFEVEEGFGVAGTPYSGGNNVVYGFSGTLTSETANISEIRQWTTDKIIEQDGINKEYACRLPNGIDQGGFTPKKNEKVTNYPDYVTTDGNVFITKDRFVSSATNVDVFEAVVCDKGEETRCTFVIHAIGQKNYLAYTSWTDNEMKDVYDSVNLYDGTDGKISKLEDLSDQLNWQEGKKVFGLTEEGNIRPYKDIQISSGVKSLRVSYDNSYPDVYNNRAYSTDLPNYDGNLDSEKQYTMSYNYHFYRNKTKMVCINGGEWKKLYKGEVSPELKLKDGLNILFIAGTTPDQTAEEQGNFYPEKVHGPGYLYFLYWDGEENYESEKGTDASIKSIECYQAAYDSKEGEGNYASIPIEETEEDGEKKRTIIMNADEPYIWLNVIPKDSASQVTVDQSTLSLGGFFKNLDTSKNYFDIKITSEDEKNTTQTRIYVNWQGGSRTLKSLSVKNGGILEKEYEPMTRAYYCEQNIDASEIEFAYQLAEGTTVKIYVDRQFKETVTDTGIEKILSVKSDSKEIQWEVTSSSSEKTTIYSVFLSRGDETGVSETTKQRAGAMIDKMNQNGYKKYLTDVTAGDYWKTFGAAALGEDYLKGMLGYDVTKKTFKQATDYAAVILELVMSGENPYDYLGTNYVDGLLSFNSNGNFGMYSANIWALLALQAAGEEIPENTINIVKNQALSEGFDLDMRGWALAATALYKDRITPKEYARCIQSIKETQIQKTIDMNGIDVSGVFENFYYTNRNIMSHACVITGLTGLGIDCASAEFQGRNGSDPVSALERYQLKTGGWFYSPENTSIGGWNKDVVIAVGDLYNGSNVYQRYFLTKERYQELLDKAKNLLDQNIEDETKRQTLQSAYDEAEKYADESCITSAHGKEYYALQDAVFAVDESESPQVFLGTAEEREQVNSLNEAIASIVSYGYEDKGRLDSIQNQYDALGDERLYHYVKNGEILEKAYAYIQAIDSFLDSVNKIGKISNVNLSKTDKVQKARNAYDLLDDWQKEEEKVKSAYETLLAAEAVIEDAKTADKVVKAISNLGVIVTLECEDDIVSVRAAYELLSDSEKEQVNNLGELEDCEKQLEKLLKKKKAREEAAVVISNISEIGSVNQNSGNLIQKAEDAYSALSNEAKAFVSNYSELLSAKAAYNNLLRENILKDKVGEAEYDINQIEDAYGDEYEITSENVEAIQNAVTLAREYLNGLEAADKLEVFVMLPNYMVLIENEENLVRYQIQASETVSKDEFIEIMNEISDVDLEQAALVIKAREIYNRLAQEEQEKLKEQYVLLEQAENQLQFLKDNYDTIQKFSAAIVLLNEITLDDRQTLQNLEEEYALFDTEVKELLDSALLDKLNQSLKQINDISLEQEKIDKVIQSIEEIGTISDLSDEEVVVNARKKYDDLANKVLVANYSDLEDAENAILHLKKEEENRTIISAIEKAIEDLKNVSINDREKVTQVRNMYDGLTDSQKMMIQDISPLEHAEDFLEGYYDASVKLSSSNLTMKVGETVSLTAEISLRGITMLWTSSDTSVVSVKDGTVKALKTGSAIVSVILENGRRASCQISVLSENPIVEEINGLNKTDTVIYTTGSGHTFTLTLKINGKKIKGKNVTWKSTNKTVAKVNKKGVVTGLKKGKAVIKALYNGKTYKCLVTVKKPSFKLKQTKINIKKGGKKTIAFSASPVSKIIFKSLNSKVVSVSKKGVLTAKKKGTVKIRVTCNKITRYLTVKVQ